MVYRNDRGVKVRVCARHYTRRSETAFHEITKQGPWGSIDPARACNCFDTTDLRAAEGECPVSVQQVAAARAGRFSLSFIPYALSVHDLRFDSFDALAIVSER